MKSSPSGVAMQLTLTEWGLPQIPIWIAHSETSFAKVQSATGSSWVSPSRMKPGVASHGQFTVQTVTPATITNATAPAIPRTFFLTNSNARSAVRGSALMLNLLRRRSRQCPPDSGLPTRVRAHGARGSTTDAARVALSSNVHQSMAKQ